MKTTYGSVTIEEVEYSLEVTAEPGSVSVLRGEAASFTVTVGGDNPPPCAYLCVTGLPPGASFSVCPSSGVPPFTATVTIQTSYSTPPGSYEVCFCARGDSASDYTNVTLKVRSEPDFTLSVNPTFATARPGEELVFTVTLTPIGEFMAPVYLSVGGLPPGSDYYMESIGGYSTRVHVTLGEATGRYVLTFTGTVGSLSRTTTAVVDVVEAPTFSLAVSPESVEMAPGSSTQLAVSVSAAEGYEGTVTLTAAGLPEGARVSFSPESGSPPFASTATLSLSTEVAQGTYEISIVGVDEEGNAQAAMLNLTVSGAGPPAPGEAFTFSVSVDPSSLTLSPGESGLMTVTVSRVSGEAEPVSLRVFGLPPDAAYSISPSVVEPDGTAILNVTAGSTGGTFVVVVLGQSDSYASAAQATLVVSGGAPGGPAVGPSPQPFPVPGLPEEVPPEVAALAVVAVVALVAGLALLRRRR